MKFDYKIFFIIAFLTSLGIIATDIYLPSLPSIANFFSTSDSKVQSSISLYLLSFALGPLLIGPIADKVGRKKVIIISLFSSIASTLICYLASNINWLIFGRFMQGLSLGAVTVVSRSLVAEIYRGKDLALATNYMTILRPILLALAPIVGGFIEETFNWRTVFLFLTYIIFLSILTALLLKEPKIKKLEKSDKLLRTYVVLLSNKKFMSYAFCMLTIYTGIFAYLTCSPFLFQKLIGMSPSQYGLLSIYVGSTIMISGYVNSFLIEKFKLDNLLLASAIMMILSGLAMKMLTSIDSKNAYFLLIPTLIYFACIPIGIANSYSAAMSSVSKDFGAATALLSAIQSFAGFIGSLIFSALPETSSFYLSSCFLINGLVLLYILKRILYI